MNRSHRFAVVSALALASLALAATDAQATHFRYGTIRWEVVSSTSTTLNVRVSAETAWRRTFFTPLPNVGSVVNPGNLILLRSDGFQFASSPMPTTVSSVNAAEDWFVGTFAGTLTVPKAYLPVRIRLASCCRLSTLLDGNHDRNFIVEAVIGTDLSNTASPVTSLLPVITVAQGLPAASIFIPASDVDGDALNFALASPARSGLLTAAPVNFSLNSSTGQITWNTIGRPLGLYAVQVIISDTRGGETALDMLLRLVPNQGVAPTLLIDDSPDPASFAVNPGTPVSFVVKGSDPDAGASLTLTSGALPPGASMTPSLPTAGSSPTTSTFSWTPLVGQAGNTYVATFAATDNLGLQDTNSASITVLDNFAPSLTCPAPQTVEATGSAGADVSLVATVSDFEHDGINVAWDTTDDGTTDLTDTVPAGTVGSVTLTQSVSYALGAHTLRITATDTNVNPKSSTCTAAIQVVDTTGPSLTLPGDQTLQATGPGGAVATWTAPTALDAVDGARAVTCTSSSGSLFPIATNIVHCQAVDLSGNESSGSFAITVQDTTPPAISGVPADQSYEATSAAGAVASWPSPTATDLVDGAVSVSCAPASGSTFPLGTTHVTCTAGDSHGNTASASFAVTVADTTPPVISGVPGDITLPATGPAGAVATWAPPAAVDVVDGPLPVMCVPASGSTFPIGTTHVTCTAGDSHGNTASASFAVNVTDTVPPEISAFDLSPGVLWSPNHKMQPIQVSVSVTDNVDPAPSCAVVGVSSNEPVDGLGDGDTAPDWLFSGLELQLRAERSGKGDGRVYTVTLECRDAAGNTSTRTATAAVPKSQGKK